MKSLEEQLKESFDHFEPEVNSSVWTKVSQQLPGSAVPSPNVGSAIKVVSVNSTVITSWIAAAAAVITGAGLFYYFEVSQPKTTQQLPVTEHLNVVTENSIPVSSINKENKITEEKTSSNKEQSVYKVNKTISKNVNQQVIEESNISNSDEAGSHTSVEHQVASSGFSLPVSSVVATNTNKEMTSGHSENTTNQVSPAPAKNIPEPILIINTRGGFAPLTVTAMSNQLNQVADFDFGDGHQSLQTTSASNRYDEPGTYTVTCKIAGKTLETTVEVLGQVTTAFSPNGDGVNDLFTVGSNDLQFVELNIFNRFGKIAFSGKGKILSWDGRMQNGSNAESGTYFYDIFVTTGNGTTYKQKGTINLFR